MSETSSRTRYAGGPVARYLLLGSTVFLMLLGLVMIFSAASVSDFVHYGSSYHHLLRQLMMIAIGTVVMVFVAKTDYRAVRSLAMPAWYSAIGLLLAVQALGVVRGGAKRWISLGPLGTFQPSEYTKVVCVLLVAALVTEWWRGRLTENQLLGRVGLLAGSAAVLVLLQKDLGTTVSIFLSVVTVLFIGGVGMRWIGVAGAALASVGAIAIAFEPFRLARLTAFLDPFAQAQGKGYQSVQALLAFGTGGWNGIGLGLSRQKFFYLPEAHTDFILAIVGEEAGLLGTLAICCAFIAFAYAGFRIALGTRDTFGRLLAAGLTAMISTQAVMNMAAVTGLIPVTGKPLPFVSFGGSSLVFTMACVGLVLSVARYGGATPRLVRTRPEDEEVPGALPDERRWYGRTHLSSAGGGRKAARRRA